MLAKVSKAIAAGLAAAAAGSTTAYVIVPADMLANAPGWVMIAVPAANFVVGFAVTYFAPANA